MWGKIYYINGFMYMNQRGTLMLKYLITTFLSVSLLSACTTVSHDAYSGEQKVNKTTIGTGTGALGGAIIGALANGKKGALIGAAVGGLAGASIGNSMDRQETELRQRLVGTGVQVAHEGNHIRLIMPSDVTFRTNSPDINAQFYTVLNSVALVLKKYRDTEVAVNGHTDNTGTEEYNQILSVKRAHSVSAYLEGQGVKSDRLASFGHGIHQPTASNATKDGRAQNRRVEIYLNPLNV